MKQNMFYIIVNVIGIVCGILAAIMAVKNSDYGYMLLMATTVNVSVVLTITFLLKAIRVIVREELEKKKTKQES
ncbi:MAG: hypothetical protein IJS88_00180 [Alphaproteobacteria bacterium]|nr:hypothetical protein [Alphaproteobacteria bacterium]